jgi:hypothetical protein
MIVTPWALFWSFNTCIANACIAQYFVRVRFRGKKIIVTPSVLKYLFEHNSGERVIFNNNAGRPARRDGNNEYELQEPEHLHQD